MKPIYSIQELKNLFARHADRKSIVEISDGLIASGVPLICSGEPADLSQWREIGCFRQSDGSIVIVDAHPVPHPDTVIISTEALPPAWKDWIEKSTNNETSEAAVQPLKMQEAERNRLLKHIGCLALALAEASRRYKRGVEPSANQIAEAVADILESLPDANKRGTGVSNIRASISEGIGLLKK